MLMMVTDIHESLRTSPDAPLLREPKNQERLLPEGYENYGSFSYGSPLWG